MAECAKHSRQVKKGEGCERSEASGGSPCEIHRVRALVRLVTDWGQGGCVRVRGKKKGLKEVWFQPVDPDNRPVKGRESSFIDVGKGAEGQ